MKKTYYRRYVRKIKKRRIKGTMQKLCKKGKDFCVVLFVLVGIFFLLCYMGNQREQPTNDMREAQKEKLYILKMQGIGEEKIPLEEYLIGALAASIDAEYDMQVLKAQAVLLRSGIISKISEAQKQTRENGENDYCILLEDTKTPYFSIEELQKKYGSAFLEQYERLKQAVLETEGLFLSYEGNPVAGTFCALSAGSTRNGSEVFQEEKENYLVSVPCESDITDPEYEKTFFISSREFSEKLEYIGENDACKVEILEKDSAGYAKAVEISKIAEAEKKETANSQIMTGEEFRELFHLPSSCMEITEKERGVRITTKGIGHGFGMSQKMAQTLSEKQKDYMEILNYFFPSCKIQKT